ncbi:MAG: 3-deoxy-D-manno-octulosonic acid transferase [Pseudomonadota bacterium]
MTNRPAPLVLYRLVATAIAPLVYWRTRKRLLAEDFPPGRIAERLGFATRARPSGQLVWFHAASIGESLSILPLVQELSGEVSMLVTTGTATSAKLLERRLPPGAAHQFAPLDTSRAARRFLTHWQVDVAVFVESEVWPNLIEATSQRATPIMLINARMSKSTLNRWTKMPKSARAVFSKFLRIFTQDQRTHDGLAALVSSPESKLVVGGNMKAAAKPLPVDQAALSEWRKRLRDRPVWIASSTHEGEEEPLRAAHRAIRQNHPDAIMVLVPRHPHRGLKLADETRAEGFSTARLAGNECVTEETAVLVADTIGDLGLWYRLSPVVFLAGSFGNAGGHNPWEPVALGAALLHGPNVANAADDYRQLAECGAAIEVADADSLARVVTALLSSETGASARQTAAAEALEGAQALVAQIAGEIRGYLEHQSSAR